MPSILETGRDRGLSMQTSGLIFQGARRASTAVVSVTFGSVQRDIQHYANLVLDRLPSKPRTSVAIYEVLRLSILKVDYVRFLTAFATAAKHQKILG